MYLGSKTLLVASIAFLGLSGAISAQEATTESEAAATSTEAAATNIEADQTTTAEDDKDVADLLTEKELDDLVAPVALYPDTLLIQILVAATYPIDVIKANRFVEANTDMEQEALNDAVDAEGWDDSVAVLAQGFPTVLANMAEHIDWTELAGSAMLAQSDDVMSAVQRMREQADSFGNLESNEQQVVSRDETESIVIAPADPTVVYVPTYTTSSVYYRPDPFVTFTTGIIIGSIWANNNPWNNYWGCNNCGGWGGNPTHYNPRNVNIGGDVNIGNNIGSGNRPDGGWNPDSRRKEQARNNIGERKNAGRRDGGKAKTPLKSGNSSRGDNLRSNLSNKSGARDISRPNAGAGDRARPSTGAAKRNKTPTKANRSSTRKPKVSKPSASRQPTKRSTQKRSSSSFQSHGGGKAARSSKNRARSSAGRSRSSAGRSRASRSRGGGGGRSRGGGGRRR